MAAKPPFIPLYYAPDIDQSWDIHPGVINTIQNYVPTKRGTYANFANGPSQNLSGPPSWDAAGTYGRPVTGYIFKAVSGAAGSARMFVCSNDTHFRIIELTQAGVLTDRSKGGVDYSNTVTNWTMTAAGNAIIACNGVDAMQVSTGGAFSDLGGGAPTGALCLAANLGFVLAGYKGDGTNGDSIGWSALGNYASWTPSLATQAGNTRLLDTPGPIRAVVPLRDSVIVYKDDSIYVGDYIGDTVNGVLWGFRLISDRVGCASPHGVAVLNNIHYFLHKTGVYAFDGAQVSSIGDAVVKETMRLAEDFAALSWAQSAVDEQEGVIYLGFPRRGGSSRVAYILMLNVNTGRWGGCMQLISTTDQRGTWHEAAISAQRFWCFIHCNIGDLVQWSTTGSWLETLGTAPICIGAADDATAFLRQPIYNAAVSTVAPAAIMVSGWLKIGPPVSQVKRIWPRLPYFGTQASTPTCAIYHLRQEGATVQAPPNQPLGVAVTPAPVWSSNDYAFDSSSGGQADRCLQFKTTFSGPHEIGGVWVDIGQVGEQ